MNKKNREYYHYTIFKHFRSILATRIIKKETDFLPNVKTCVWFSTNPSWENTVMKALRDPITGNEKQYYSRESLFNCDYWDKFISPGELHSFIPVRLKLDNEKINFGLNRTGKVNLRPWNNYKKTSGFNREMIKALAKTGMKQGANPKEWFVSYEDVSIKDVSIDGYQRWDGTAWVDITMADLGLTYPLIMAV
ncbi:MAG: hypothetical protein KKE62_07330 [Proteobacteria bacterium]|nr:hypothetical protein [Pseudomonadota bacterium]MBU1389704.1 hypothetical protein [Pseudomonadota bacterium]MBU1542642.1 hypothetical protein [Pseudomonadota bacterium]MBU2479530.1 hypothetical protein [Pseudomonadota bacterium]